MKNFIFRCYVILQNIKEIIVYEFNRFKIGDHIADLGKYEYVEYEKKMYTISFISKSNGVYVYRPKSQYGYSVFLKNIKTKSTIQVNGLEILKIKPKTYTKSRLYKLLDN